MNSGILMAVYSGNPETANGQRPTAKNSTLLQGRSKVTPTQ